MKLQDIIQVLGQADSTGPTDSEILGVAYDSRKVRPGYLFAALPGRLHDGREFISDAVRRGAVAILSEQAEPGVRDVAHIKVSDGRQSLAEVASLFYDDPSSNLQTVGITGTNGKTTVASLVRDILAADGRLPGLVGTVCYEIGDRIIPAARTTPEAPDLQNLLSEMLRAGCKTAVIEVSSHSLVQKRVWGVNFDAVVFTNLTHDHLDYHQDMENYFEAKSLLFSWVQAQGRDAAMIINVDDTWGERLLKDKCDSGHVITYGCRSDAMVRAEDIELSDHGSEFNLQSPWGSKHVSLDLMGRFNISNALAAIATCGGLDVELEIMVDVIAQCKCVRGRLEEVPTRKGFRVFVDYAHTDDALKNVLQTLREIRPQNLILVFGCGGNRDRTKRRAMGAAASQLADHCILTSDNPRQEAPGSIIEAIQDGFGGHDNFEVVEDRSEAIRRAVTVAQKGDVVLIAGKGHECFQELADRTVPFDDRKQVLEAIGIA
jgi:UDP-N-acetylmuramoyl-L-alanyl-D-glutamate--2,6-diaminopimelate ligase